MSWFKKILSRRKISIAVFALGNAAGRVGELFVGKLKENNISVRSLLVNQSNNFSSKIENFDEKLWVNKNKTTSRWDFNEAIEDMKAREEEIRKKVEDKVFFKKNEEKKDKELALHLILGSGGGTGAAGATFIAKIVKEITGVAPTVIFILPEKDEPSLIQYNTARALNYLGFDKRGPQCPIILFDNEKYLNQYKKLTLDEALQEVNKKLAETLVTTILAALQEPDHDEFNATLSDFFNAFTEEARGIGAIVSFDKDFKSIKEAQKVRYSDIFFKELENSTSIKADIYRAKRGYFSVNIPYSYQTTFETRKIVKKFEKGRIKVALSSINEPALSIRGILTGIHPDFVDRFWEILELARDTRKENIKNEKIVRQTRIAIKIKQ